MNLKNTIREMKGLRFWMAIILGLGAFELTLLGFGSSLFNLFNINIISTMLFGKIPLILIFTIPMFYITYKIYKKGVIGG